jgi:iron complex outermembrane receptor protein
VQNQYSFAQNKVADYESSTAAYNLVNIGGMLNVSLWGQNLMLHLAVLNVFNTAYYDHLSRYKSDGIYNMGRNVTVKISVPLAVGM